MFASKCVSHIFAERLPWQRSSILLAAGQAAGSWTERVIAVGGTISGLIDMLRSSHTSFQSFSLLPFFTDWPQRLASYLWMYVILFLSLSRYSASSKQVLSISKIIILLFVVISGWVVLSGKTSVADPYVNFRNAFAGSSTSSNDVRSLMFTNAHPLTLFW